MDNYKMFKRNLIRIKKGLDYLRLESIDKKEIERLLQIVEKQERLEKEFYRKVS